MSKNPSAIAFEAFLVMVLLNGSCAKTTRSVETVPSPAGPGSTEASLCVGGDGRLYLSWIEPQMDGHVFQFSRWEGNAWTTPRVIARGREWVVNWADVPALTVLSDGRTMMAHWLLRAGTGGEASRVQVARSLDGGSTWSSALVPHRDSTETEHGFVSWNPLGRDRAALVWLDGRETATGGATTLRFTTLDADGRLTEETLVDSRVCDCCPTDLAGDDSVLIAVYRDRSEEEVRDIRMARFDGKTWTQGHLVHADGWKIAGCPVNGPALAMRGKHVAVAWFTVDAGDNGHVRVAFSQDGGNTFQETIEAGGPDPLGRVDVALADDANAWVLWLETGKDGQAEVRLRKVDGRGKMSDPILIGKTSASRASGIPRLACAGNNLWLAWTSASDEDVHGAPPRVLTARIR